MNRRFPRLRASTAITILSSQSSRSNDSLAEWQLPDLSREYFAPTGPQKVSSAELMMLRAALHSAAMDAGFPNEGAENYRNFDRNVTRILGARGLPIDEMLRADTWAWIAVHVAPYLVRWRWQKKDGETTGARYYGILQRNALGRLWYRAFVLDQGVDHTDRWALADAVTEDASVQLLERTAIASDRRLARSIMKHWISASPKGNGESLFRDAVVRLRIQGVLRELAVLEDSELDLLVASAMNPVEQLPVDPINFG